MDKPIGTSISCLCGKEGDFGREMYGRYNEKGRWIVEECKYLKAKKEVKKVKKEVDFSKIPYFEVKVVKVKKEKKDFWCGGMTIDGKQYKVFKREKGVPYLEEFSKGNIVNGENLDKIKFPCFCRWADNIGMIIYDFWDIPMFTLIKIDKQTNNNHTYSHSKSLEKLIRDYDIHILKGKILIFENEKESK